MNDINPPYSNSKTPVIISALIKTERTRRKLSQREFAKILTVSYAIVSQWENEGRAPDANTLFKVSRKATEEWARKLALSCLRLQNPDYQINRKEKPITPVEESEPA